MRAWSLRVIFDRRAPPTNTSPLVGASRLPAMVSRVLLPDPLAPMTATREPGSTQRSMSCRACTWAAPSP